MKPDNMDAKEMACLCISLYDGIALAGEMKSAERIPEFLTDSQRARAFRGVHETCNTHTHQRRQVSQR